MLFVPSSAWNSEVKSSLKQSPCGSAPPTLWFVSRVPSIWNNDTNRRWTFLNVFPKELDVKDATPVTEDNAAISKRPGFSGVLHLLSPSAVHLFSSNIHQLCVLTWISWTITWADSWEDVLLFCLQSAWSPSCPGLTWPTRCESRSRICSTGSMGRRWASSTPSKCLTKGSRTTQTRSSLRACPPAFPSGSPAPLAPRTWRGSWRSLTKSVSPSRGGKPWSHDRSRYSVFVPPFKVNRI